ncbi:MAG: hypothetical protein ACYTFG_01290, partial [Planctomycetota bacterium]
MGLDVYRDWLGIPEEDRPPNLYRLFGLPDYTDDSDEIERASRGTIGEIRKRQLDPAHKGEVQDLLTELARARAVLKNRERRFRYDRWLMKTGGKDELPPGLFAVKDAHGDPSPTGPPPKPPPVEAEESPPPARAEETAPREKAPPA